VDSEKAKKLPDYQLYKKPLQSSSEDEEDSLERDTRVRITGKKGDQVMLKRVR